MCQKAHQAIGTFSEQSILALKEPGVTEADRRSRVGQTRSLKGIGKGKKGVVMEGSQGEVTPICLLTEQ